MTTASFHYPHGNEGYGHPGHGSVADPLGSAIDGRAGRADFSAKSRGGCLRTLDLGRETSRLARRHRPLGAFGADAALRLADRQGTGQVQRGEGGTSRSASVRADVDRPSRGTHPLGLPQVSRAGATVPGFANAGRRGHSHRHHAGGHRTHDPSLLVSPLQDHRRAYRARCLAGLHDRPAGRGALGLAALPAGHDAGASHRCVQLPSPVQAVLRRPDPDVAAVAGGSPGLVPRDRDSALRQRGVACRRDRVAGQRQDLLVVVFRVEGCHLLHDRPAARQPSLEAVRAPGEGLLRGEAFLEYEQVERSVEDSRGGEESGEATTTTRICRQYFFSPSFMSNSSCHLWGRWLLFSPPRWRQPFGEGQEDG